jgi:hypothetical protein
LVSPAPPILSKRKNLLGGRGALPEESSIIGLVIGGIRILMRRGDLKKDGRAKDKPRRIKKTGENKTRSGEGNPY